MAGQKRKSFFQLLSEAISHFVKKGFASQKDLKIWVKTLRESLEATLPGQKVSEERVRRELSSIFTRTMTLKSAVTLAPGITGFTLDKLKPAARKELERRIFASVNLIKLNREEAVASTLRRFEGWLTSIPEGGSNAVDVKDVKERIRAPMASMDFKVRRVLTDQSNKFSQSLKASIAETSNAIAARWNSQWQRVNYDYREDHKDRDKQVYTIRDNWAIQKGYMKVGPAGYTDAITQPAEEVYCRCTYTYIYGLRSLPESMLTEKGREFLARNKK